MGGWIFLALVVLFFYWASFRLRDRIGPGTGPDAASDRHRRTGGYGEGPG